MLHFTPTSPVAHTHARQGNIDYKGFIIPRNRGENVDDSDRVLACQFAWKGQMKKVTTMFIGEWRGGVLAVKCVHPYLPIHTPLWPQPITPVRTHART